MSWGVSGAGGGASLELVSGEYSVTEKGAVGDGATDDTLAIQAAIDAAAARGGGTVFFPAGTYKLAGAALVLADHVTLRGSARGSRLTKAAGVNVLIQVPAGVDDVVIEGLSLEAGALGGACIDVIAPNVDVHVRRCVLAGNYYGLRTSEYVRITDCTFQGSTEGAYVASVAGAGLVGCTFRACGTGLNLETTAPSVVGCQFVGNARDTILFSCTHAAFTGCTFSGYTLRAVQMYGDASHNVFSACTFRLGLYTAVHIASGSRNLFVGCTFVDNCQAGASPACLVELGEGNSFVGCHFSNTVMPYRQDYGVQVTGATRTAVIGCQSWQLTLGLLSVPFDVTGEHFGNTEDGLAGDGVFLERLSFARRIRSGVVSIALGGAGGVVSPNSEDGNTWLISSGANLTVNAPNNAALGARATFIIYNNGPGAIVTTWGAMTLAGAWVDPAAINRRSITFLYDGVAWREESRTAADQL